MSSEQQRMMDSMFTKKNAPGRRMESAEDPGVGGSGEGDPMVGVTSPSGGPPLSGNTALSLRNALRTKKRRRAGTPKAFPGQQKSNFAESFKSFYESATLGSFRIICDFPPSKWQQGDEYPGAPRLNATMALILQRKVPVFPRTKDYTKRPWFEGNFVGKVEIRCAESEANDIWDTLEDFGLNPELPPPRAPLVFSGFKSEAEATRFVTEHADLLKDAYNMPPNVERGFPHWSTQCHPADETLLDAALCMDLPRHVRVNLRKGPPLSAETTQMYLDDCPAVVTVQALKRFVSMKFGGSPTVTRVAERENCFRVEISATYATHIDDVCSVGVLEVGHGDTVRVARTLRELHLRDQAELSQTGRVHELERSLQSLTTTVEAMAKYVTSLEKRLLPPAPSASPHSPPPSPPTPSMGRVCPGSPGVVAYDGG